MSKKSTDILVAATKARSQAKYENAIKAIKLLEKSGHLTFAAVQREAGVSRMFLYKHSDLRSLIELGRSTHETMKQATLAVTVQMQKLEIEHLNSKVKKLEEELRILQKLKAENAELLEKLKHAYKY